MKLISSPSRFAMLMVICSILVIASCKKETSAAKSEEEFASQASTEADAESEFIYDEVFDNVMGVNNDVGLAGTGVFGQMNAGSTNGSARLEACVTVTVTQLNAPDPFPVKIVMDFGSACVGRDGRTRSGKIISVYTNRLIVPGAKATTTFDNYRVDSIKVEGTHIITNQSVITTTNCMNHVWKVAVENGKLSKPNGNYTEWNSTNTIAQIEGTCTPYYPLDDIYKITGSAGGKVKRGDLLVAWKSETIEPLVKKFTCRWLVKGSLRIARLTLSSNSPWIATIDYGAGDCDRKAKVTINGVVYEIILP